MTKTINFAPGDLVKVYEKVKEAAAPDAKDKEPKTRTQIFEGTVIAMRGRDENKSFTVRKIVEGIGVEKVLPLMSPSIEKVVVREHPKKRIRRSKLYYLRNKTN